MPAVPVSVTLPLFSASFNNHSAGTPIVGQNSKIGTITYRGTGSARCGGVMEIVSFARYGYEGEIVKVEADLRRGIPAVDIVGLPDGAVREARERMRAAIRNSGFEFPRDRVLINLSPASLKKEGSSFDLPIALAVLGAIGGYGNSGMRVMILGELELSGAVRPVTGILAAVSKGLEEGITHFVVPSENRREAELRAGARVFGVTTLREAIHIVEHETHRTETPDGRKPDGSTQNRAAAGKFTWSGTEAGLDGIKGQNRLIRALVIAAAGGHNLLVYGPPGCGKTLSLRGFSSLLPDLDERTAVDVTRIHSIAGMLDTGNGTLVRRPPFREPAQNASVEGMIGGGAQGRPGEVSLAHGGTLFLDEAAHFRPQIFQALRNPLETGEVTITRAQRSSTYPARFQLLMAVNPCPCGNAGCEGRVCTCAPDMVERHWKRLTAPLVDRIDLRIAVRPPRGEELEAPSGVLTSDLRLLVATARKKQAERGTLNARLEAGSVDEQCALLPSVAHVFCRSMEAASLSGRGGHGILKTARTIADLEDSATISEEHILEAVQYRRWHALLPDIFN